MTIKSGNNINMKLFLALGVILLMIFSLFYYISHREITDPHTLGLKAIGPLRDTKSYRFTISTNLTMQVQEGNANIMKGEGSVDYRNKKLWTKMIMGNRSVEIVMIGDTAYIRESAGYWKKEELDDGTVTVWGGDYDVLGQQRSVLLGASNITMQKTNDGWILNIVPDKEVIIEQLKKNGAGSINEDELKSFIIRYWIDEDKYRITRIENQAELEVNIAGLVTPIEINSIVTIKDYNEEMKIEAPVW